MNNLWTNINDVNGFPYRPASTSQMTFLNFISLVLPFITKNRFLCDYQCHDWQRSSPKKNAVNSVKPTSVQ